MKHAHGFSLLEVLIAFALLSVGISTLAAVSGLAVRAADDARRASVASVAADQKLESLRALSWGYDDLGTAITDVDLGVSPSDSLTRNVDGYFEYLDAAGRDADPDDEGASAAAPSFVRRWSIQPLPAHPLTSIVIEVLVVPYTGSNPPPSAALSRGARRLAVRTRRSLISAP